MAQTKKTKKSKSSVKVQDLSTKKNPKGGLNYSKVEFEIKK
jgi:hypothetical protein